MHYTHHTIYSNGIALSVASKVTAQFGYFAGGCRLEGVECSRSFDLNPFFTFLSLLLSSFLTKQLSSKQYKFQIRLLHCKNWSMIFIPNYHWNHTKFEFGMISMVIWYEYHTSVFAVYSTLQNFDTYMYQYGEVTDTDSSVVTYSFSTINTNHYNNIYFPN